MIVIKTQCEEMGSLLLVDMTSGWRGTSLVDPAIRCHPERK